AAAPGRKACGGCGAAARSSARAPAKARVVWRGRGAARAALGPGPALKVPQALEATLASSLAAGVRALPWRASLALGARLGDAVASIGVRRRVAEENLARAFPERGPEERPQILRGCYRELGRVPVEYGRPGSLA